MVSPLSCATMLQVHACQLMWRIWSDQMILVDGTNHIRAEFGKCEHPIPLAPPEQHTRPGHMMYLSCISNDFSITNGICPLHHHQSLA